MKKESNYKIRRFILTPLIVLLFSIFIPTYAKADMGPKESVTIKINTCNDEPCFAMLFTENRDTYQLVTFPGSDTEIPFPKAELNNKVREMYETVKEYFPPYTSPESAAGSYRDIYYISEFNNTYYYGYMLPDKYFLALYYPKSDTILYSYIYSNYAFDSYYSVDAGDLSEDGYLTFTKSNNEYIQREILRPNKIFAIILRLLLTVGIELLLALAFKIRSKKSILTIVITNVVTQIGLNICLILETYYLGGGILYLLEFLFIEFLIFIIEAIVYSLAFRKTNNPPVKVWKSILYSFVANLTTFLLGIIPTFISLF